MNRTALRTGIDKILDQPQQILHKKVGLLANQSSVTCSLVPSAYALQQKIGPGLCALFTPEHGWSAFLPEFEGENKTTHESKTNLPIFSLYGKAFEENVQKLVNLDVLLIDLQDVGVRCYTYAATCAKVLQHASCYQPNLEIIVCDRPNPLGAMVHGPWLDPAYRSLVGYLDEPYLHGQSMGALLQNFNQSLSPSLSFLNVQEKDTFHPLNTLWIPPSPGLPDLEAVYLYPGLVFLEGTNVSEGRGSSFPFHIVAAPHLDSTRLMKVLNDIPLSGIRARPFSFTPLSGKLAHQACEGVQIHITDYTKVRGDLIGIYVLYELAAHYPAFQWTRTGERYWIDLLTGNAFLRQAIENKEALEDIRALWEGLGHKRGASVARCPSNRENNLKQPELR